MIFSFESPYLNLLEKKRQFNPMSEYAKICLIAESNR